MSTRQKKENPFKGFIIPVLCLALLAYFAHHAQTGRYNIHTKAEMKEKAEELKAELRHLREQRAHLTLKVRQLSDGTLEKDALDEVARYKLGLSMPDEIVILR